MADSNEEWIEEESVAVIELNGIIDQDALQPEVIKILGPDTERPVLQVDGHFFTGTYEEIVGTAAIFENVKENDENKLKYLCKTSKKLTMQRSFLQEKVTIDSTSTAEGKS